MRFRVLGGAGEELTVEVEDTATFDGVAQQICAQRNIDSQRDYVRIICGGSERRANEPVRGFSGQVLHYMVVPRSAEDLNTGSSHQHMQQTAAAPPATPVDWLDTVDPGALLVYLLGGALILMWLTLIWNPSTFSRGSIFLLCAMTAALVVPWARSCMPPSTTPTASQPGTAGATAAQHPSSSSGAGGSSQAYASSSSSGEGLRHRSGGYSAPPRPPSLVRPGQPAGGTARPG